MSEVRIRAKRREGAARKIAREIQQWCNKPEKWAYSSGLLTYPPQSLPGFLGIGATRAGSTWLWQNLRCHPELFLPDQKELHYFNRRYHRNLAFYAGKFQAAKGRLSGEITPAYSILPPERIRFIRRVMPKVKLILLLRDPVERAWSHALLHLLKKVAVRRYEDVPLTEFYRHLQSRKCRAKGDYLQIIANWTRYFPPEQLYLGFFDDITRRPEELFGSILDYLQVAPPADWSSYPLRQVINRGTRTPMPPEIRAFLQELYAPDLERLRDRFGDRVAGWGGPPEPPPSVGGAQLKAPVLSPALFRA